MGMYSTFFDDDNRGHQFKTGLDMGEFFRAGDAIGAPDGEYASIRDDDEGEDADEEGVVLVAGGKVVGVLLGERLESYRRSWVRLAQAAVAGDDPRDLGAALIRYLDASDRCDRATTAAQYNAAEQERHEAKEAICAEANALSLLTDLLRRERERRILDFRDKVARSLMMFNDEEVK